MSARFRSLTSFFISLVLNLIAAAAGGFVWRGFYPVQVAALLVCGSVMGGCLLWRALHDRAALPRTGFGRIFAAGLLAGLLATAFSPDPRLAWPRLALFGVYILLFYLLVDGFDRYLDRAALLHGALAVGWFVGLLGMAEVYAAYSGWFAAVGPNAGLPPGPFRLSGILGHSNALMPYMNLLAPLAWTALLRARRPAARVLYAAWLLFFLVTLPFSSSRGGWMGFIAWVGVLLMLAAWRAGFSRLAQFAWTGRSWLVRLAWLPVLGGVGYAGLRVWQYFSAHASHGSAGLFDSRSVIWQTAWAVFRASPWLGAGPGRFAYEYLVQNGRVPPEFWAQHAHSMPLEVLAEFGLAGFAVFLGGLGVFGWQTWRKLRRGAAAVPAADFDWDGAALAGLAGLAVHCLVEDPTRVVPAAATAVLLLAWLQAPRPPQPAFQNRLGLWLLLPPSLALLGFYAWSIWSYQPMAASLSAVQRSDWAAAAAGISASQARDPNFVYYEVEAGLAFAQAYAQTPTPEYLDRARTALRRALQLEPGLSLVWANLAVLDWQAGSRDSALESMRTAARLAPPTPAYWLNLAWMEAEIGQRDQSAADYRQALDLSPAWASHPFWKTDPLRSQVLTRWLTDHPDSAAIVPGGYAGAALQAAAAGRLTEAALQLARGAWTGEEPLAVQMAAIRLEEARGNAPAAAAHEQAVANLASNRFLVAGSPFVDTFNIWLNDRNGLLLDLVPGFLQLQPDLGQADALQHLAAWHARAGLCQEAQAALSARQTFLSGGALPALAAPELACPSQP